MLLGQEALVSKQAVVTEARQIRSAQWRLRLAQRLNNRLIDMFFILL